jgi:mannose-6-phosphate isomerase-like protein (cupin superfamily)
MTAGHSKQPAVVEANMTEPYVTELEHAAKKNGFFRQVLFTGDHSQLVVMSLEPGEEIGTEVHTVDQMLYVVDGEGETILDGIVSRIEEGGVVCVPAGVEHNIVNTDDEPLKLFTVYAPAQHPAGTVHRTKADAMADERTPAPV